VGVGPPTRVGATSSLNFCARLRAREVTKLEIAALKPLAATFREEEKAPRGDGGGRTGLPTDNAIRTVGLARV
jgi:hypothetical protein